ncbi:MAG: hypothetical protein ACSHWQ_00615 [Spongiibacteraceae bacterium]
MKFKHVVLLSIIAAVSSVSAHANIGTSWKFEKGTNSTGFTTAGKQNSVHQFGMLKHNNVCSNDELYLTWTSTGENVWSLPGKRLNMVADFDGVEVEMPLEVVSIKPMSANKKLVVMAHLYSNSQLLELIKGSQKVKFSMPSGYGGGHYFDTLEDTFALKGFIEARSKAQRRCNSISTS